MLVAVDLLMIFEKKSLAGLSKKSQYWTMISYSGFQLRSNIAYRVEFHGKWHGVCP